MTPHQKVFAIFVCLIIFFITFELVRKRTLREEYSVLWLSTSVVMFFLILKYDWLVYLTSFIGAKLVTTTLFIGSIIFLVLISVQYSIKLSRVSDQIKNLTQENALLKNRVKTLEAKTETLHD